MAIQTSYSQTSTQLAYFLEEAIKHDPFKGFCKPEPLKYLRAGTWSRRITQEHRLVYVVSDAYINFV